MTKEGQSAHKKPSIYNISNVLLRTALAWALAFVILFAITVGALWAIVQAVIDAARAAWRRLSREARDLLLDWPWRNLLKSLVGR